MDVHNMKEFIQNVHRFLEENIAVVVDDGGSNNYPMRSRIMQMLKGYLIFLSKILISIFGI